MSDDFGRDPARDGELGLALRDVLGEVPGDMDWEGLRGSITTQAELPLARLRRGRRSGGGWRVRSLVPLAAAAGIAAAALALTVLPEDPPPLSAEDLQMVEQVVDASLSEADPLLTGEAAREALLEGAVGS
ncbi:MAG TPA: hypothetical protein VEW03_01480 [Longimicrobiaceae bacterium]|nr:hypothetical protein [Longimicrobiaceae bacterium]